MMDFDSIHRYSDGGSSSSSSSSSSNSSSFCGGDSNIC
jgi:hypothetical protein